MLSDIEIATAAQLRPMVDVAQDGCASTWSIWCRSPDDRALANPGRRGQDHHDRRADRRFQGLATG